MERASSCCIFMSAMRWRSAWKVAIVTPNCLRVFMYSAVSAIVLSMHAHGFGAGGGDADVDGVLQAGRPSAVTSVAGASLKLDLGGAAAVDGGVAAGFTPCAPRSTRNSAILPPVRAGTRKASAWSPAGTMLLVAADGPVAGLRCLRSQAIEAVARLALLVRQHHQRLAGGDLRQPLPPCTASGA
jgi:hypothetical protein